MQPRQAMCSLLVASSVLALALVVPVHGNRAIWDFDTSDFDDDLANSDLNQNVMDGELEMEKRFLPWYNFKHNGKPLTTEHFRKADVEKRGQLELVTFPCFRKSDAVCQNGGRGPRVLRKGKGIAMCACMCQFGYTEARCQKSWWYQ